MARKDNMLRAFLSNKEFCEKYDIPENVNIKISEAKQSNIPIVKVLAEIIDKEESSYSQIINYLNDVL